jgi:starvation-inducible DNA-binding protein
MEDLLLSLRKCHANTFVMYFKSHAFHWNVEGIYFPTYHDFFFDLYVELFGAIDPFAENIRKLGEYAPTGLNELYTLSSIDESNLTGDSVKEMIKSLIDDNNIVLECLNKTFQLATSSSVNKQGLADFIAGRIDTHEKHGWQLRASLKGAQ